MSSEEQSVSPPSPVLAVYHARRARFAAERDDLTRRWNRVANLRLLAFGLGAILLGWGFYERSGAFALASLGPFALFAVLVVIHTRLGRRRRHAAVLHDANAEALHRVGRAWDALPLRHAFRPAPDHPFAADLDLFGRASLLHLLDTTTTPMGQSTLRDWLLDPAPPATARERQEAVAELAPRLDLRQEFATRGRLRDVEAPDPAAFLAWAEDEPWLAHRRPLVWGARVSVVLFWLGVAAHLTGIIGLPLWLPFLLANVLLYRATTGRVHERIETPAVQHDALRQYAALLALLTAARFASPALARLQQRLTAADRPAPDHLRRLALLTRFWIPHHSLPYVPIQAATLWDIHLLDRLERWQTTAGPRVRGWLAALGEVEALAALAALAHDNPGWTFPDLDGAADRLEARALGHPLIPETARVANDVTVGPPGTVLLVTGSNMSGKSTLLRSLGVNIVLAGAGGPACAAALRLPPVALWTSVRVQDSLERGVSFFMAELQRLKQIADGAAATGPGDPRPCFLLDEILQGTNTAERQIAARRVIRLLVDRGAIGAVSTHDLTLAEGPELAGVVRPVHFRETVGERDGRPAMWFDYTLRPGLATSTNALKLMELVGFELDGPVR